MCQAIHGWSRARFASISLFVSRRDRQTAALCAQALSIVCFTTHKKIPCRVTLCGTSRQSEGKREHSQHSHVPLNFTFTFA